MLKQLLTSAALAVVVACSPVQVKDAITKMQDMQASVQTALTTACTDVDNAENAVNAISGLKNDATVQVVEGYAGGACLAGKPIAAFVTATMTNPQNVVWAENIANDLNGLAATNKAGVETVIGDVKADINSITAKP